MVMVTFAVLLFAVLLIAMAIGYVVGYGFNDFVSDHLQRPSRRVREQQVAEQMRRIQYRSAERGAP